jgi:CHAD domain-containing protein
MANPEMPATVERELKLSAGPGFHLPDLEGVVPAVHASRADAVRMETTYYDTPDLRLARWGCSLRYRSKEGWTVKLPMPQSDAVLERNEITFDGPPRTPPRAALRLVRAYLRRSAPQPVARLSTLRHRVRLTDDAGKLLAEVVDDEVSVLEGRRVASRFREVEIELREGDRSLLAAVEKRLLSAGSKPGDSIPKHVRALGPKATAPPEVAPAPLPKKPRAGQLVANAIASALAALFLEDPAVRLGRDPEAVHNARVAVRTLRSHLRTFGRLLEGEPPESDRLRDLGSELGEVRDREVLLALLQAKAEELPAQDQVPAAALLGRLEEELEATRGRLAGFMDSDAYVDLLDGLVEFAKAPAFNELAELPAAQAAVELARRPWRRLRKAVQALPEPPEPEHLHRIRILAKRSRYAAEAVAPVVGKRAVRFAEAAAALQSVLGEYHDAVTAEAWLRVAPGTGRRAFVAGELAAAVRARGDWMRSRWPAAWDSLTRKRLREWFNR